MRMASVLACSLGLLFAGCVTGVGSTPRPATVAPSGSLAIPESWKPVVQQRTTQSSSALLAAVVEDGVITESELNSVRTGFVECMAGRGWYVTLQDRDRYDVDLTDDQAAKVSPGVDITDKDSKDCERQSGFWAVSFYFGIRRNPENLDERQIMASCLARKGLVPAGYTSNDFERDTKTDPLPAYLDSDGGRACSEDPLH